MTVSSSMYAAVTGLSALGTGMQTISNNIANVNTVGFKAMRTNYEDLISQSYYSGGKVNQVGSGVKVSSIQSLFTQGSFMASAQDTDMAIAGEGFFSVRNAITNEVQYTRAGVFELDNEGKIVDPSGNVLQGWEMSIPAPGEEASRIGAPTDIKITVLNAPPVETSEVKVVVNLNADDADNEYYNYHEYPMADEYAVGIAGPAADQASTSAMNNYWDVDNTDIDNDGVTNNYFTLPSYTLYGAATAASTITGAPSIYTTQTDTYNSTFLDLYNASYNIDPPKTDISDIIVMPDSEILGEADYQAGQIHESEFNSLIEQTTAQILSERKALGETVYSTVYKERYDAASDIISSQLEDWQLEGNGFAEAWDASDNPPIDTDHYAYQQPLSIYDSLGSEHVLNIYYQPNPHQENLWDYIITVDPIEDARMDANGNLLLSEDATFTGLIQKGKITFTGDGDDRHGGVIKDIEAQNIDLSNSTMATSVIPEDGHTAGASATMLNVSIGGYYTGSPKIDPTTGIYESTDRNYEVLYGGWDAESFEANYDNYFESDVNSVAYNAWFDANKTNPDIIANPSDRQDLRNLQSYLDADPDEIWGDALPVAEAALVAATETRDAAAANATTRDNEATAAAATATAARATATADETAAQAAEAAAAAAPGDAGLAAAAAAARATATASEAAAQAAEAAADDAQALADAAQATAVAAQDALNEATAARDYFADPANQTIFETAFPTMTAVLDYQNAIYWSDEVDDVDPPVPGLSAIDTAGWKEDNGVDYIRLTDDQHAGPYEFGSGLTLTFDTDLLPLNFNRAGQDGFSVECDSEQIAWTNLSPNEDGLFDFDVAFVQSASMALHPPYPDNLPTITQSINMDMGARYNGSDPKWILDEESTTQYATESSTTFWGQDGYPAGSLQRISVGEDGVITGIYTNGRQQPLFQVGLTYFLNPWGLSKEGDNLFSETRYSGAGAMNEPGYGGTGTILGNFLEQSTVDLAEEIVNMIVTQRGYQANSKTVTTTDSMLEEIIAMKR